ncbi:MAG: hypothetical protein ACRD96_23645 [Bryobacteraceae bacterium]
MAAACCLGAQSLEDLLEDKQRGYSLYTRLQGSVNDSGSVTKLDTTAGYTFNRYFGVDAGLPLYIVRPAAGTTILGTRPRTGVGNAWTALRLTVPARVVTIMSVLTGTAPTGDSTQGFSTGAFTADWTTHFYRHAGRFMPFGSLGVANTISDTPFYLRPFSSRGLVRQFEAGSTARVWRGNSLGASAYWVRPGGEQTIVSKLGVKQPRPPGSSLGRIFEIPGETVVEARLARDQGFSMWYEASPRSWLDADIGYSRSRSFALNSLFFSVGVNWKALVASRR